MYNYIIDLSILDYGTIVEPVTVAEAKLYCRVTNNIEDNFFLELITQSRQAVEKAAQISIVPKIINVWFNNLSGKFEMPFGPMNEFTFKLYNEQNIELTEAQYQLVGEAYPSLYFPNYAILRAQYHAGEIACPKELKIAILDQINYGYENRGMDVNDMGICEKTWRVCQRWTRTSPIL